MFEPLFYITSALSIALLGILLTRHETAGNLYSQIEALKRDSAELRQKLKEEFEQNKITLGRLRDYYNEQVEREKKNIDGFHAERHAFLKDMILEYEKSNEADNLLWQWDSVDTQIKNFDEKRGKKS